MWVYVLDNVIPAQVNNSMTDFIWNTLWWCTDAVFIGISMNMQYNNSCLETKVTSACTGYSDLRCTSCLWMRNIRQALMEMNFSFMNTKADVFGPIWMKPYLYLCQSHLSWFHIAACIFITNLQSVSTFHVHSNTAFFQSG